MVAIGFHGVGFALPVGLEVIHPGRASSPPILHSIPVAIRFSMIPVAIPIGIGEYTTVANVFCTVSVSRNRTYAAPFSLEVAGPSIPKG